VHIVTATAEVSQSDTIGINSVKLHQDTEKFPRASGELRVSQISEVILGAQYSALDELRDDEGSSEDIRIVTSQDCARNGNAGSHQAVRDVKLPTHVMR
jgi:hypothetical protein